MKQDKLEKFIIDNRDDFDVFEPGDEIWDRIQKPTPKVIKLNWQTIAIRVAAVVVIFIASYFFHDLMQKDNNNNIAVVDEERYGRKQRASTNVNGSRAILYIADQRGQRRNLCAFRK